MKLRKIAVILLLAAFVAIIVRMFFFETIRVNTSAMSESQPRGNRLIIEKISMGARLPVSIGLPFAPDELFGYNTFFSLQKTVHRFRGFSSVKRNDLIAYNFPGMEGLPIDREPILLSRCVGLPGELLKLDGTRLYINGDERERPLEVSTCYRYPVNQQKNLVSMLKAGDIKQNTYSDNDSGFVYLNKYQYYNLMKRGKKSSIVLDTCKIGLDQQSLRIPYEGYRIELNDQTFQEWSKLINRYEGVHLVRLADGRFRKNGKEAEYYVFKQNYYWMLNDHQGYLNDSRNLGPIPESHLIGRACMIFFSPSTLRFMQKI